MNMSWFDGGSEIKPTLVLVSQVFTGGLGGQMTAKSDVDAIDPSPGSDMP